MKSEYQKLRNKKRLAIYLLRLAAKGEVVKLNLRALILDIYKETGEVFAKTDYGVVFETFVLVDSDEICFPSDPATGCGDGFNTDTGLCSSNNHKPSAPILIPAHIDKYPEDPNVFPGNIFTVSGVLPTLKSIRGIKKKILANSDVTLVTRAFQMSGQKISNTHDMLSKVQKMTL